MDVVGVNGSTAMTLGRTRGARLLLAAGRAIQDGMVHYVPQPEAEARYISVQG